MADDKLASLADADPPADARRRRRRLVPPAPAGPGRARGPAHRHPPPRPGDRRGAAVTGTGRRAPVTAHARGHDAARPHGRGHARRRACGASLATRRRATSPTAAPRRWPPSTTPTASAPRPARIRHDVLADLPAVLERFADRFVANGGHVHWAADAADANALHRRRGPPHRRPHRGEGQVDGDRGDRPQRGPRRPPAATVVETDLGEWIIQLAGQTPSHIIAPAVHLDRHQIRDILQEEVERRAQARLRSPSTSPPSPASSCGPASSPPTSACPGATSPWPRPARSCSSRTRATAGSAPRCPASTSR